MSADETPDELRARLDALGVDSAGWMLGVTMRDPALVHTAYIIMDRWCAIKGEVTAMLRQADADRTERDALLARLTAAERQVVDWNRIANAESARGDDLAARLTATEAENANLARWKVEAMTVLTEWDACYDILEAVGRGAPIGRSKARHVAKYLKQSVERSS